MTYRIYLRDPNQRVTDKTATESKAAALAAFDELVNRTDLDGQKLLAVLNQDGRKIAHHNFQARPGEADHWSGRLDQIAWPSV
jgi:hypothetical protein